MSAETSCFAVIRQLIADDSGADVIEYGLLAAFIGVAAVLTWKLLATAVRDVYSAADTGVQGKSACTPNPGGGGAWCSAFTDELQAAVNAVDTGDESPVLSGQLALDALRLCHAEAESIKTFKAINIG